jgi:hypothetical protein
VRLLRGSRRRRQDTQGYACEGRGACQSRPLEPLAGSHSIRRRRAGDQGRRTGALLRCLPLQSRRGLRRRGRRRVDDGSVVRPQRPRRSVGVDGLMPCSGGAQTRPAGCEAEGDPGQHDRQSGQGKRAPRGRQHPNHGSNRRRMAASASRLSGDTLWRHCVSAGEGCSAGPPSIAAPVDTGRHWARDVIAKPAVSSPCACRSRLPAARRPGNG